MAENVFSVDDVVAYIYQLKLTNYMKNATNVGFNPTIASWNARSKNLRKVNQQPEDCKGKCVRLSLSCENMLSDIFLIQ